jgi:DNA-binding FrmR family transcriptional regulator
MKDTKTSKVDGIIEESDCDTKDRATMKKDIQTRLRRIEGQVKGIEKMIDNEVNCRDIVIQIAAVRAAVNKVGGLILENYAKNCISKDSESLINDKEIEDLLSTLLMFLK